MESLEKSLLDMQDGVEKASAIMKDFDARFNTEGAVNTGAGMTNPSTPPKTGNPKDEQALPAIEVQHFTRVE